MGVRALYESTLADRGFHSDSAQQRAIDALERCEREWADYKARRSNALTKLLRRPPIPRGVYMHGGVGRGKSFLMDTFFEHVAFSPKRRVHFHRFMREIHARLRDLQGRVEPMAEVAVGVAGEARLLCLDEFQVTDIGDAMLMRKLLEGLFEQGVTIVTTSNTPPERLYLHGLQRSQFLPAIALIERQLDVMHMDDGTDYRQAALERAGTYHVPPGAEADANMAEMFRTLTGTDGIPQVVSIEGRPVSARAVADGAAWFEFAALQGEVQAQHALALLYDTGSGVAPDPFRAVQWLRSAARKGYAPAKTSLGLMYARGRGVAQDHAESVRWFRAAAQQGDAVAQALLGLAFLEGRGLPQDYAQAVRWFRMAAREGHAAAQHQLGLRYELGQGVARDLVRAHLWFNLAATEGDPASVRHRDRVAARMSARDLETAQRLARACFEGGLSNCE